VDKNPLATDLAKLSLARGGGTTLHLGDHAESRVNNVRK
jgi:hypothetical protein